MADSGHKADPPAASASDPAADHATGTRDEVDTELAEALALSEAEQEKAREARKQRRLSEVKRARTYVARIVWTVLVVFAIVLAVAALFIALDANTDNDFVSFVLDFAKGIDLGIFDLDNPIKSFGGDNADTKTALLNYGIGAVFYLVVGRIAERLIRP